VADSQRSGDSTADSSIVATRGDATGDGDEPFRHLAFGRCLQIKAAQMPGMRGQRRGTCPERARKAGPHVAARPQRSEIADEVIVTRRRPSLAETDETGHCALCSLHIAASRRVGEPLAYRTRGVAQPVAAAVRVKGRPCRAVGLGDRWLVDIQPQRIESAAPGPRPAQIDRKCTAGGTQHCTPRGNLCARGKERPQRDSCRRVERDAARLPAQLWRDQGHPFLASEYK